MTHTRTHTHKRRESTLASTRRCSSAIAPLTTYSSILVQAHLGAHIHTHTRTSVRTYTRAYDLSHTQMTHRSFAGATTVAVVRYVTWKCIPMFCPPRYILLHSTDSPHTPTHSTGHGFLGRAWNRAWAGKSSRCYAFFSANLVAYTPRYLNRS